MPITPPTQTHTISFTTTAATASISWPAELPDCPRSWTEQDEPDVVKSAVDVGPGKVRRRSTYANAQIQLTLNLPVDKYDSFQNFWNNVTLQGIEPFYYKHPVTRELRVYRFKEAPSIQMIPGNSGVTAFAISMQWEGMD